jgi:ABC-type Mn2+/Zn2+ transport system ATPase subunit
MTEPWLLRMHDVARGYSGRALLSIAAFHAHAREVVCLVGENGSGKSTLLRALAGVLRPLTGRIERSIDTAQSSYVAQTAEVPTALPLTVAEYVELAFVASSTPRAERPALLRDALAETGISELTARNAASLSGGQRRRMMLARALARRPRLLLVDEPEAALDRQTRGFVSTRLHAIAAAGACVVVATHDAEWLAGARVWLLDDGVVREAVA